jgi:hypothetical protein
MEKSLRILILEDRPSDADLMEFELQEAEFNFISKRVMSQRPAAQIAIARITSSIYKIGNYMFLEYCS